MANSLLAVRDINHKYIIVERRYMWLEQELSKEEGMTKEVDLSAEEIEGYGKCGSRTQYVLLIVLGRLTVLTYQELIDF